MYEDATIAAEMGIPLSEFWSMTEMDRAYLIAYHRSRNTIAAYEHYLAEREMKRQQRRKK